MTPDTSLPVVVVSGQTSHHYGGLGVARSLGRWGVPVHWAHPMDTRMALRSRYVEAVHPFPIDVTDAEAADRLCRLDVPVGTVLLPVDDRAAAIAGGHAKDLAGKYRMALPDPGLAARLSSKQGLHDLCREHGIPTADVFTPKTADELERALTVSRFPVVLKRIANWVGVGMDRPSVRIAETADDVRAAYADEPWTRTPNLLIQEYIPGGPDTIWMFDGYFDARATCRFGLSARKLRQSPVYTGYTSLGVCEPHTDLTDQTIKFLETVGYTGPVDLGYRYDERDGTYKLLDVNPRLGSTFRLFVDSLGYDVARVLYLDLTEQPYETGEPMPGRKWVLEGNDIISSVRYRRDGRLSARQWLSSLRGVEEGAWWAADDPIPFAAMLGHFARRVVTNRRT